MDRVLVTGANGFVGKHLCPALAAHGHAVTAALRRPATDSSPEGIVRAVVGEIGPQTQWDTPLEGCDTVIHLAARVHVMRDSAVDPWEEYRRVNVEGTQRLLESAVNAGVKRFIYLSSVKATADWGTTSPAADPYGASKSEAEEQVRKAARNYPLETVILRPPLVYGAGVKANFLRLIELVDRGIPLPFASVDNRRSLVYVGNLVSAIMACVTQKGARNGDFFVTDGPAVSTPYLIDRIANALGKRSRLLPFPPPIMRSIGSLIGRRDLVDRLIGSLEVDDTQLRDRVAWQAPYSLDHGLEETIRWYRERRR